MPQKNQHPNQKPKKKKGHHPAHQNTFAFRHNPKSKLTAKILSLPNEGLCRRCHEKIEWRKKYRKYKPLTQPSTCNLCKRKNVTAAYHTICDGCALSDLAWKKMVESSSINHSNDVENSVTTTVDANDINIDDDVGNEVNELNEVRSVDDVDYTTQEGDDTTAISDKPSNNLQTTKNKKVCAMCVKDLVKEEDGENSAIETQIEENIRLMEQKLNRPLKLRESKAIERKIHRDHEKEKARLKEERRRAREGLEANNGEDGEDEKVISESDQDSNDESVIEDDDDDDDSADPFLQAVGGKDKLLTGEAYQQMMLQKMAKIQISN